MFFRKVAPNADPAVSAGLSKSIRDMVMASLDYIDARWRLLKADIIDLRTSAVTVVAAAVVATFGGLGLYFTSTAALLIWIARKWWGGDHLPALLIVSGIHLFISAAALLWARHIVANKLLLRRTLDELQADKLWLQHNNHPKSN